MKYKLMSLFMIGLICLSAVGACSAYTIDMKVDTDGRICQSFTVCSDGSSRSFHVFDNSMQSMNISDSWQNKQVIVSMKNLHWTSSSKHILLINFWNGHSDILMDVHNTVMHWKANGQEGWSTGDVTV